jgi:SAM-dependent methyltransferase
MSREDNVQLLHQAGRRRLYPRVTDPNWLVLRARREIFRTWIGRLDLQNARVVDIGGRIQPYRALLPNSIQYCSVDLSITDLVNAVANAESLPFADNTFDLAMCTQMLEYAPHPKQVLSEIHRVLPPSGTLLLSAPSIFPRDSGSDTWRFFPPAFRSLLAGFSEVEILPEGGSAAGFLRTLNVFVRNSAKFEFLRRALDFSLVPLLNLLGMGLDRLSRHRDGSFTVNYSVRARK